MQIWIKTLLLSLVLTWILETLVFLGMGIRKKKDLLLLFFINLFTNPMAVTIYQLQPVHSGFMSWIIQIFLEIFVVLTEGILLYKCMERKKNTWILSLAANGVSYLCGAVYTVALYWK